MVTHDGRLRIVGGTEADDLGPPPLTRAKQLLDLLSMRYDLAFSTALAGRFSRATWVDHAGKRREALEFYLSDLMSRIEAEFNKPQYSALSRKPSISPRTSE
jgi:hypothetical protein